MTRRRFLGCTAAAAAGCAPHIGAGASVPRARIAIGLIGAGNINTRHREAFLLEPDARIVAVCDPIASRREAYRERIDRVPGHGGCVALRDFRDLLARDDIDAVCIGTPDHWHAVQAIAAMESGKDVYVEKPLTYAVAEGRRVVETAARLGRVLQTGLQRRCHPAFRHACELVRNGRIGRLTRVEVGIVGIHGAAHPTRAFPAAPVPPGVDYDLWLGPAPAAPFCPERIVNHYWYHIADYSRGFIPGNGVHYVDVAQWAIGDEVDPIEFRVHNAVTPAGGLIDTVVEWHAEVLYQNGVSLSFSSEGRPHPDGIRFQGADGWIHVGGGGQLGAGRPDALRPTIGPGEIRLRAASDPHRDFLDCIRTRRAPAACAAIGHRATTTCNAVEIAARLGRALRWDAAAERFLDDPAANRLLTQPLRAPWRA